MSTSHDNGKQSAPLGRMPLRLALADPGAAGSLTGVWWPQSRSIDAEVGDLVDNYPAGHVSRVLFSRPDWDTHPRSVPLRDRRLKTGSFPSDDTQLIVLTMADFSIKRILVVPPTHPRGDALMQLDLSGRDHHDAQALLAGEEEGADEREPSGQWVDEGALWWHPNPIPPSHRS